MGIEFDRELSRGPAAYEDVLGRWWHNQSSNASHGYAYRRIADYLRVAFTDSPGLIVDYACGPGNLLYQLATRFPHSRFVGLDSSSWLLDLARRRLAGLRSFAEGRITLIRTVLPDLQLRIRANMVVFAFPNMLPGPANALKRQIESQFGSGELDVARALAGTDRNLSAETRMNAYCNLLWGRLASRNLRSLLQRGGHCIRVEYATVRRDEMTRDEITRSLFEEGAEESMGGRSQRPSFRVIASAFFRSGVIEDVQQQVKGIRFKGGGYQITVLRAL